MRCPRCGEETGPGKTCERCEEPLPRQKDLEVEYKEFKVSELLDIKMPARERGEKSGPLPLRDMKPVRDSRPPDGPAKKTILTVIMIVLIIVLAAIATFHFFVAFPGF